MVIEWFNVLLQNTDIVNNNNNYHYNYNKCSSSLPSLVVVDGHRVTRCGPSAYRQCQLRSLVGEFQSQTDSTLSAKTYTIHNDYYNNDYYHY